MKLTTREQALEFYRTFLKSLNVTEDENGFLLHSISNRADPIPLLVKDKQGPEGVDRPLVMPTKENLRRLSEENLVGFNPLSESTVRGESETFRKLKRLVTFRINQLMLVLMQNLARLSVSGDATSKLNAKQIELVAAAIGPDLPKDGFVAKLNRSYAAAASEKSQIMPVTIYIKRDAKQPGSAETYKRAATVAFPYAVEAAKLPKQLGGVTFAQYELRIINNMLDTILPGLKDQDAYSYYGNPATIPNFTALAHAWYSVASMLNESLILLDGEDPDITKIDLSWYSKLNQLPSWAGVIPPLEGNIGDGEEDVQERIAANRPKQAPVAPVRASTVAPERTSPQSSEPVRQKMGSASRDRQERQDHRNVPVRRPVAQPRRGSEPMYEDDGVANGNDLLREMRRLSQQHTPQRRESGPRDPYARRDGHQGHDDGYGYGYNGGYGGGRGGRGGI